MSVFHREKRKKKKQTESFQTPKKGDRAREEPTQTALRILYSRGSWQNKGKKKAKK